MKKITLFFVIFVILFITSGCGCSLLDAFTNRSTFNKEVKKYIESGQLFKSVYNNVERVIWIEKISDGRFLVAVEYTHSCNTQYYEVRSFYFPLSNNSRFISELKKLPISYLSSNAIEKKDIKAFGWIVFEQLRKRGNKGKIWGNGCAFKKNQNNGKYEWKFPHSPRSYLNAIAKEGIGAYRHMSRDISSVQYYNNLGTAEKICLVYPLGNLSQDYRIATYKHINNAIKNIVTISATYVIENHNDTHMELKKNGTFYMNDGKITKGKYRIKEDTITFMINGVHIKKDFESNFLIGPYRVHWTRTD